MKRFLLLICLVFLNIGAVHASTCFPTPMYKLYKDADIIFSGVIINDPKATNDKLWDKAAIFKVKEVYKGAAGEEISVSTISHPTGTGSSFKEGQEYMVFANARFHSFDQETGETEKGYLTDYCAGTRLIGHPHIKDQLSFIENFSKRMGAYDRLGSGADISALAVLQAKAEHYLYWRDYPRAEENLREILTLGENEWAFAELLRSLYEQNEPQKIWDIYLGDKYVFKAINGRTPVARQYERYIHFAAFVLGHEFEKRPAMGLPVVPEGFDVSKLPKFNQIKPLIRGVKVSGLSRRDTTIQYHDIDKSTFNLIDFSGSKLDGQSIWNTRFVNSNFMGSDFSTALFGESEIVHSKLSGADFSKVDFRGSISLNHSTYDCKTKWPEGFDAVAAGAENIDGDCQ